MVSKPTIKSGKFSFGSYFTCGENVTIEVAEEMVVGDRVVLPDNAYFSGRRIEISDDFFGYAHWNRRLEVGRGRIDEEDAILTVGSHCTMHDNKIDLARRVTIGNDVGLSPEVCIYTHFYWQSVLEGYPCKYAPVTIGDGVLVGYRSVVLPGAFVEKNVVIGAQSVVSGKLVHDKVYAGSPAKPIRCASIKPPRREEQECLLWTLLREYTDSRIYRQISISYEVDYPTVQMEGCSFDVEKCTIEGEENELTDDLRWFLFTRGVRIYTQRPFKKMGRTKQ